MTICEACGGDARIDENGICEHCRIEGNMDKETYRGYKVGDLRKLFKRQANKQNWKDPPKPFLGNLVQANKMVAAFDFFLGGSETKQTRDGFIITSRGYYYYIGA